MEKQDHPDQIPRFTIPALMNLDCKDQTEKPHYSQELIALCDSVMEPFHFPCRIDAIIISVCTQGECTIVSNLSEYTLTKGSMFICGPKTILQVKSSSYFRTDVLAVAPNLLTQARINLRDLLPLLMTLFDQPCIPIGEADHRALHNLIALIESEVQTASETTFTPEIIHGLISTSIAKLGDILTRYIEQHPRETEKESRGDAYFRQFMQLLGAHYKQERSVGFYAGQMCITPKYLTTLIKRFSKKSVSEWIDDYVILEAKTLLKYSNMSIQEVAYDLNFTNQSFFGSYFKRNTGLSPSQYKLQ